MTDINDATQQKTDDPAVNLAVARAQFESFATPVSTRGKRWYIVDKKADLGRVAATLGQVTMYYQNGGDMCAEADQIVAAVLETEFTDPKINKIKMQLVSSAVPKKNVISETRVSTSVLKL